MPSIRQKITPSAPKKARISPPDFRNLGVLVRTLLAVNLLAALTMAVGSDDFSSWLRGCVEMAGLLELPLMVYLVLVYLFAPLLSGYSYLRATIGAVILAIACLLVCFPWLSPLSEHPAPLRWSLWAATAAVFVMIYFHWRASAAAPAIAEARMLALNARIRPHFFFNSLNGVLGVIRSDPHRAEQALESLADLFRALMQENRELVTLQDEIDVANRYLDLERLRLGDRLKLEWDLRHCPFDAKVPPLMLQPLIENAVYHGVEPLAEPGAIRVKIGQRGRELHIRVINPLGDDAPHQSGNRMALNNIRERLDLFFDLEAHMDNGPHDGCYEVHIRMPLKKKEDK